MDLATIKARLDSFEPLQLPLFGRQESAVLLPIVGKEDGLYLVLTRRAATLPYHAGEISFPGGRVEASDKDSLAAALREANEEIGLVSSDCEVLGTLDDSATITGYRITPHVVFVNGEQHWRCNEGEVDEVIEVPLDVLAKMGGGFKLEIASGRERGKFPIYPFGRDIIWGATARIIAHLLSILEGSVGEGREGRMRRILKPLLSAKKVLLSTHVNPDPDGLGAEVALESMLRAVGTEVTITNHHAIPDKYRFLSFDSRVLNGSRITSELSKEADLLCIVDTAERKRIGDASVLTQVMSDRMVVIDHHLSGELSGDFVWAEPETSSTSEMVYHLLRRAGFPFTRKASDALYAGIMFDTGGFRYVNNHPGPFKAASHLVELGADATLIQEQLFSQVSRGHTEVLRIALNRVEYEFNARLAWSYITLDELDEIGATAEDASEITPILLATEGVEAAAFFREVHPGRFKLSMRSLQGVMIGDICQKLGGGGHANAAGATLEVSPYETMDRIRRLLAGRI